MVPSIGELVSIDEKAEFRNDVQLSNFENSGLNLGLLRSYLFSKEKPEDQEKSISPIGVLNLLVQSFLLEKLENRFAVIGNYGHGKSHLALALINYFSKSYDSEEVQILLNKIRSTAAGNDSSLFADFKKSKGEFLVIRIRGDIPRSIREQFTLGMEEALKEHSATINVKPDLWCTDAEKYLTNMSEEEKEKANQYLTPKSLDVPLLLNKVRNHQETAYSIVVNMVEAITKVIPDFKGRTNLSETIGWLVNNFCGQGKPFGGLLVVFDELSQFIYDYSKNGTAGELLDLLNGIENHRSKAAFIAFTQHDPNTIAREVQTGVTLQSLEHELTRIPESKRYVLYSLLESVVDAYLKQSDSQWQSILSDSIISEKFLDANDLTLELFQQRYRNTLNWGVERFQETVSKGCFPLHPITTALLANVEFQQAASGVGVPRSVLGFVLDRFAKIKETNCIIGNTLNWILPFELIDYFVTRIPSESNNLYKNALKALGHAASEEESRILKALLLQELANITPRQDLQISFIAQCSGLEQQQTKEILVNLKAQNCIRQNIVNRTFGFWPSSVDPAKLENIVNNYIEGTQFNLAQLNNLREEFFNDELPIKVNWGNPNDWSCAQRVITSKFFTEQNLKLMVSYYKPYPNNGPEYISRGFVFWICAKNEAELMEMRSNANHLINSIVSDSNITLPILFVFPQNPTPELLELFTRKQALAKFTQDERIDVGQEIYTYEVNSVQTQIMNYMNALRGGNNNFVSQNRPISSFVIPSFCQAQIQKEFAFAGSANIQDILDREYKLAYRYSPPEFFPQYRASHTGLQTAIKIVAGYLLSNNLSKNNPSISNNAIAKDICNKILFQEWHLISPEWKIIEPANQLILIAWREIDQYFAPTRDQQQRNMIPFTPIVIKLLNSPFGYDFNTITLLLTSWVGFNAPYLQFSHGKELCSLDLFTSNLANGPKKFIQKLIESNYSIERNDPGELANKVRVIISKVNSDYIFNKDEVISAISELRSFYEAKNGNPADLKNTEEAMRILAAAKGTCDAYENEVKRIDYLIDNEKDITKLINLQNDIQRLRTDCKVEITAVKPSELRFSLNNRIFLMIGTKCISYERLTNLKDFELNKKNLKDLKDCVAPSGNLEIIKQIEKAISNLEEKAKELEVIQKESSIIATIKQVDLDTSYGKLSEKFDQIKTIRDCSQSTKKLKEDKICEIKNALVRLDQIALNLQTDLDKYDSSPEITEWKNRYFTYKEKFSGSKHQKILEESLEKANRLSKIFADLNTTIYNKIQTPQEADESLKNLQSLAELNRELLSDKQNKFFFDKETELKEKIKKTYNDAHAWVEKIEQDYSTGSLSYSELKDCFLHIPAFINNEDREIISRLQSKAEIEIEKDSMSIIENEFYKIRNKTKQLECIERLKRIAEKNS
jgi:hypothetical protein